MKKYLPHVGVALGLALALYALFFADSDEDAIRALLERFETTVRVTPDDTNVVVRAAHIKGEFKEIFSKEVSFQIPELSSLSSGRTELAMLAAKAPQLWATGTVNLDGLAITIGEAGLGAVAVGNAVLNAARHNGQLERDSRQVSISLEKIEGDWRIVGMSVSSKDDDG